MKYLFSYNWMIRKEWFQLLETLPLDELIKQRTGGVGNILKTMFHIVTTEHNWICDLKGIPILGLEFSNYTDSLDNIVKLSETLHLDVNGYLKNWSNDMEFKELKLAVPSGMVHCTYGEALRHIIAHEIHHIGQLSIWTRGMGIEPISANLIHKGIMLGTDRG